MNCKKKAMYFASSFIIIHLCSCTIADEYYNTISYTTPAYDPNPLYPSVDANSAETSYRSSKPSDNVIVPESYHVGQFHSPTSFKDRDRTWVSGQNAQNYTIEIAEGEKASQVARVLYGTPKTDRMAQIKYQWRGKTYYRGMYGSYPDAASAQSALDALPSAIKQNAQIKDWGSMQQNME